MTRYDRRSGEVADYESRRSGRSRSRGYKKSERDRSYSSSRSRSRSRSKDGIRGKIDDTFDTSMRGLGVGLAGAIAGGLAGRQFGHKHRERDILIGAVVGGKSAIQGGSADEVHHQGKTYTSHDANAIRVLVARESCRSVANLH